MILTPIENNIPTELKRIPHWVCWKSEIRDGKPTKPPYDPRTGGYAQSNNPETWADFATAMKVFKSNGHNGIGFVLTESDPFVGFDLDHCRDPETGTIEPWAKSIVDGLKTYTEISPSGEGIRGFLKGKLPPGGSKKGNVEFYETGRYLTVTGHKLNDQPIENRQTELKQLHKQVFGASNPEKRVSNPGKRASNLVFDGQHLIDRAFKSRNGDKIRRLWVGDWADYPSHSEADQALCNHLAFWFDRDPGAIDAAFRDSGLMREKWDKKHFGNGRTYGQATIENAIASARETYQSGRDHKEKKGETSLDFPTALISGAAGDFAKVYSHYMEAPTEFFYFGFLTALGSTLSDKVTLASELRPEPRMFTILLGESGDDRKSTVIKAVMSFFHEYFPESLSVCYGVGSAEGLQDRLSEIDDGKLLLIYDELKALISKCKIEASVLLPCIKTLFENNAYESRTKKSNIKLENIRLSFLAASTVQTFENIWTSQFLDIGFTNRLFLVPGTSTRKNPIPLKIPALEKKVIARQVASILEMVGDGVEMSLTQEAMILYNDWYLSLDRSVHARRIDTYAMRLMPLLAVNDHKREIDIDVVKSVIAIMDWQLLIREQMDPIDADNKIAQLEEKIRRKLKLGAMRSRDLKRRVNYQRVGIWIYEQAVRNLTRAGEIAFSSKTKTWSLVK